MIELNSVVRVYGNKTAVDGLDLKVPRGELFAFLGPNGAGKTTTIKMIVGLLRPTSGTVAIGGFDVVKQPRLASQQLSYVPDEPYLYDKLTGREFLQFIGQMYGLPEEVCRESMAREIDAFDLAGFLDDLTEDYSHGMRQRLAFAAAMLHDPKVLVLDEPMVGLDPRSMRVVKDMLRARATAGMTIFMSTHTLNVAEEIADRIGIVNQGRLKFLGTVQSLRQEMSSETMSLEDLYLKLTSTPPSQVSQGN
jgi:ABC-2 type transport system ATP-binding protein